MRLWSSHLFSEEGRGERKQSAPGSLRFSFGNESLGWINARGEEGGNHLGTNVMSVEDVLLCVTPSSLSCCRWRSHHNIPHPAGPGRKVSF